MTWTNYRAIGKTADEARMLCQQMKDLDNAGAYAAELEVVPHNLATFLSSRTRMILMSLGSGSGCDTQCLGSVLDFTNCLGSVLDFTNIVIIE